MFDKDNKFGFISNDNNNSNNNIEGLDKVKSDINNIKGDLGDEELTTTNKDIKSAINEVNAQYKDIVNKINSGNTGSVSNPIEPQLMDMPRIYFSEGTLPTSKTATMLKFDYYSKSIEYHGWVEIKCQGNSSMSYPKKNFTIKLYKDKAKTEKLKINFKGWGKQSKFVLKANWIDLTHARNVVSARIWGDIVKSRSSYTSLPELLRTSPNQGAIDGFPIVVYGNGYYQGRYTLNIPKDKWMSNMDDTLDTHCILCGENYYSGCFLQSANINGNDWTDELHDIVPASIKTRWNEVITFVKDSTDADFKANLNNYIDVESAIDYLLYGIISTGLDAFGKNQIYMTYDGTKWIASMYDMDSTWGLWWDGSKFVATDYAREQFQDMTKASDCSGEGNKLYVRLQKLFINEIKARYTELRQTIFTYPYLVNKFEEFTQICPQDVIKEDYASTTANNAYTAIPSKTTNNIQQLRSYINARLTYVDSYINSLIEPIPCTAITLDKSTLSFTTADAQTLIATVTPSNTTYPITWTASPSEICSVENGVVTPIAPSGNCIITATCGDKTATCNVNVNVDLSVKGLTLNKKSANLTISTADESKINLLEGIGHDKETGDIMFDEVTLSPGTYVIKNINQGNFQYLGYYVGDAKYSQDVSTTNEYKLIVSETANIKVKLYNGNSTAVDGNIGLFKLNVITTSTSTPFVYESDGAINSSTSTDCQISQEVTLDTNKQYILRKTTVGCDKKYTLSYKLNTGMSANWLQITDLGCDSVGIIENANSIQISYAKDNLSSIELVEVKAQDASNSIVYGKDTLAAILTPTNAINKNVTWTANNENIELIADGLNCTIKAKAVGSSVVTCTSQDTTNGTITDTCNVTVSGIIEKVVSTTWSNGYLLRTKNEGALSDMGTVKTTSTDIASDFIPCTENDTFTIEMEKKTYGMGVVAYDSNKNYLSTLVVRQNADATTLQYLEWINYPEYNNQNINSDGVAGNYITLGKFPIDTSYIRICYNDTTADNFIIHRGNGTYSPDIECPIGFTKFVFDGNTELDIPGFSENESGKNGSTHVEYMKKPLLDNIGNGIIVPSILTFADISLSPHITNLFTVTRWNGADYFVLSLPTEKVGTTLESVKAWLTNNPVTIYYKA